MPLCLYDPDKMSKWHFVPRGGTMWHLEFSLPKKGVDVFKLSYSFIGIIFFGETFMVTWSYNNITIFHLKILNLICSCNCTIHFYILQSLWRTAQDDTFERSYTKVHHLFLALTAGSLLMYPYVYKYIIMVSCKLTWQCTVLIKITYDFRCIFAFNFQIMSTF